MLLATEVDPGDQPALTVEDGSFLTDVLELGLEDMAAPAARLWSLADFQSLLTWTLKAKQQNTGIGLPWPAAFEATTKPMKPHLFKDAPVAKLIQATDQLPPGTELCLHLDRSETVAAFIPLVRYLRQKYLPYQRFTGCSILRGTFGHRTSLLHLDEPSAVFMWKHNSSTNPFYISSAAALFPTDTFSIQEWPVVTFMMTFFPTMTATHDHWCGIQTNLGTTLRMNKGRVLSRPPSLYHTWQMDHWMRTMLCQFLQ